MKIVGIKDVRQTFICKSIGIGGVLAMVAYNGYCLFGMLNMTELNDYYMIVGYVIILVFCILLKIVDSVSIEGEE